MIERVKRWFASCGAGRVGRQGMCVQSIIGRTRNPRVLLYRSRFVSRFGKLRHHNSARLARTKAEDSAPNVYPLAQKIDATSLENQRKTEPNRRKIVEKSFLAGFRRPRPFRGRGGTRSGRDLDAPKPSQERSWDAPGSPRAAGRRPRASPGRSQDAPGPVRSDVGVCATRQAQSDASSERFFVVFVLSRESSDVLFVSVFTVFCWVRAM